MEVEQARELPFLDVLVKQNNKEFHTSIFRKPTYTDSYINYQSNHHPATKIATICCLKKRAENICQGEALVQELKHIEDAFVANNYPGGLVRNTLRKRKRMTQEEHTEEEERILCMPYIKGVSEILQRTCRPLNVKVVHKAPTTLHSLLTKAKTPIPKTS